MKKRFLLIFALLIISALILSSCKQKTTPQNNDTNNNTDTNTNNSTDSGNSDNNQGCGDPDINTPVFNVGDEILFNSGEEFVVSILGMEQECTITAKLIATKILAEGAYTDVQGSSYSYEYKLIVFGHTSTNMAGKRFAYTLSFKSQDDTVYTAGSNYISTIVESDGSFGFEASVYTYNILTEVTPLELQLKVTYSDDNTELPIIPIV